MSSDARWTKAALDDLNALLERTVGRNVSRYDEAFVEASLTRRLLATGAADASGYFGRLAGDRAEAGALLDSLNVGYSEFFRNPLTFAFLEQTVLPGLVEGRERFGGGEIRIWSAACAAGQEAYSVAIQLEEMAAERGKPIPFRIIATDVSNAQLAIARKGVYDDDAVRNVRLRHLRRYFSEERSEERKAYAIAPGLRDRVDFSSYDLLDERSSSPPASIYGDFDLVLCCNLLFYYRPSVRRLILERVRRGLSPNGYLVTGEAERAIVQDAGGFRAMTPPTAVFRP